MQERKHIIVGTAGHVDHGKTLLTAALTGIDTDRLPEEKRRGMTIVPGFVALDLKSGRRLGLIDVPGHEKFIKNMISGVAGIDMVMLVVAADEGVMPQTIEHLNILHLLDINKGIIAITKSDMVDKEWLAMIIDQVRETISNTKLKDAPIVPVSAVTGHNIDKLLEVLDTVASEVTEKSHLGYCRLPVDRVFSKTGFGTIITGTLWAGKIVCGQKLQLIPGKREVRVRGLHIHGKSVNEALAGQRTAINLAGIETSEIVCGSWLAEPGLLRETYRIDISLNLLHSAKSLAQRTRVRIHHGTAEVIGRINLLDRDELKRDASCLAQLILEKPLSPLRNDRLIIRSYSPVNTIGGAIVIDPIPPRHKRFNETVLQNLTRKAQYDKGEMILDLIQESDKPLTSEDIAYLTQTMLIEVIPYINQFIRNNQLTAIKIDNENQYMLPEQQNKLQDISLCLIRDYHKKYPLRSGIPVAELRQRVFPCYHVKQLSALLEKWQKKGLLIIKNATIYKTGFECTPNINQKAILNHIIQEYETEGFSPPEWKTIIKELSINQEEATEYLTWLINNNKLIKLGDIYYSANALQQAEITLRNIYQKDYFSIGQARDTLLINRKFTQLILEYLDSQKITVREGDHRRFLI